MARATSVVCHPRGEVLGKRYRGWGIAAALAACAIAPTPASAAPPEPASSKQPARPAAPEPASSKQPARPAAPEPVSLNGTWEITDTPTDARVVGAPGDWRPTTVPGVFSADADPPLSPGTVKQYRLRFTAPETRSYDWALRFEQVRRVASVHLNGRYVGGSIDPYTPFEVEAKGLVPGELNELVVTVDNQKRERLNEGWWNWGGIVRPVTLLPVGRVSVTDLSLLSDVQCEGEARRCDASLLVGGLLSKLPPARGRDKPQPLLTVRLRAPDGRVTRERLRLRGSRRARRRVELELPVRRPRLWSPGRPSLYDATVRLSYRGRTEQVERTKVGLRSVEVKRGLLYVNNRRVNLRGASMHEDQPGQGAAITPAHMDATVRELKELGANVTRAHYVLSERLLRRFDRAGIMVWNQAPIWQRDNRRSRLLSIPRERRLALAQVAGTVRAARNHPSVITHSVSNELAFQPDKERGTRIFLRAASKTARELDPTLPISLDIKTRVGYGEQLVFRRFDMIGINQYFGWYGHTPNLEILGPYLRELRDHYPGHALVMTEFGAEGRPDMADAPPDVKGGYRFQADFVERTLAIVDAQPYLSGAIHWTLREFEIFPGWRGGAEPGPPSRNTRHHKGVLTYDGEKKPVWQVLRDHFARTPLYR